MKRVTALVKNASGAISVATQIHCKDGFTARSWRPVLEGQLLALGMEAHVPAPDVADSAGGLRRQHGELKR